MLDLTIKKGMNKGWFGNADAAYGTEDRYMARMMVNYIVDKTQFSLIGSANNVNDQGFSGGGGGPRWRRNNGLVATKHWERTLRRRLQSWSSTVVSAMIIKVRTLSVPTLRNVSCRTEVHTPIRTLSTRTRIRMSLPTSVWSGSRIR